MGVHLAAKRLDIKSFAHPTSIAARHSSISRRDTTKAALSK
jgi:hypothetical protein